MKISEYRTVTATDATLLDKKVNDLIQRGFEPYGSPYVYDNFRNQAMVKPEREPSREARI